MNNGIFKFQVFRRRRAACKVVATISAFAMICVASLPAFAAPTQVLNNDLGGAAYNRLVGVKGGTHTAVDADHVLFEASGKAGGLIDWQALNVGSGQGIEFQGSQFFNVVSGGDKSQIAGSLKASGALWIFNPAGVSFLDGANVTAGGLFAVATAGLANQSQIEEAIENGLDGTPVPQLGNMGGNGSISSAAGAIFKADQVAFASKNVSAVGDFSGVNQLSIGAADKVVIDEVAGGRISINISDFTSDTDLLDDVGVELGEVDLGGGDFNSEKNTGDLLVVTEGSVLVKGAVKAEGDIVFKSLAGDGASAPVISYKKMSVASGKLLQGKSVSAAAAGRVSVGGDIEAVDGDVSLASADEVMINGTVSASGVVGGNVAISGYNVGNFGTIAANGTVGDAGSVRINAANAVALGGESAITANAGENGNGGTVEVVAQNYANIMKGSVIEAKGGTESGNGGFVETSGYKSMNIKGKVDATAANGKTGTWLIDPYNVEIVAGTGNANMDTASDPYRPTDTGAQIGADDVVTALGTADVTITTTPSPDAGSEAGKITVNAAIDYSAASHDLTLTADNDIAINAAINGGDNNFTATAGNAIGVNDSVSAKDVTLEATAGGVSLGGAVTADSLTITAGDDVTQTAAAEVGSVSVTVADGKDVTLDNVGNKFGSVSVVGATDAAGAVSINDADGDLALGAVKASGLTVNAAGTVSQTAAATVSGTTAVNAGSNAVTLGNTDNDFGSVGATGGAVTVTDKNAVALDAVSASSLSITAGGAVTQNDGTVAATILALSGSGDVSLAKDGNAISKVTGTAASVDLKTGSALTAEALATTGAATLDAGANKVTFNGANSASTYALKSDADIAAGATVAATAADGKFSASGKAVTVAAAADPLAAGSLDAATVEASTLTTAGTVSATTIDGAVTQNGGTVVAKGDTLEVTGTTTQNDGVIGDDNDSILLGKAFTQNGGTINASQLQFLRGAEQTSADGTVNAALILLPGTGSDVLLAKGDNKIGKVNGYVNNLSVRDTEGGVILGNDGGLDENKVYATGTVTIEAVAGDITQEGDLYAAGLADLTAQNITLVNGWNRFVGGVKATATADNGSVRLTHRGDVPGGAVVDVKGIEAGVDGKRGDVRVEAIEGGGISVSGAVNGGNVTLKAENGITENAAVNAAADKYVNAADGDINVNANSTVGGNVAYVADGDSARVNTAASVSIVPGANGTSYIKDSAVETTSAGGSATSKDGVTTFTDASVVAIDTTDSVVVNNNGVSVTVGTIDGGGVVTEVLSDPVGGDAHDGTETVTVGSGTVEGITAKDVAINVTGDPGATAVSVEKPILAKDGDVSIVTEKGDIVVDGVDVKAGTFTVNEETGVVDEADPSYTVGNLEFEAGNGVAIKNGAAVAASGNVSVTANGSAGITIEGKVVNENVTKSKLAAHGSMTIAATKEDAGSVVVENGYVGTHGTLDITAAKDVTIDPSVVESTDDLTIAAEGDVVIEASRVSSSGTITIGTAAEKIAGNVIVRADSSGNASTVMAKTGLEVNAEGGISVSKSVIESGLVYAGVDTEDIHVSDATADMTLNAGKAVTLESGARVGAADEVDVDANAEGVTVDGSQLVANGAMTVDAEAGAVTIKGGSFVGGNSTVAVGMNKTGADGTASLTVGDAADGDVVSQLVAKDDLTVKTTGAILAQKGAKVGSDADVTLEGASVTAQTGAKVLAAGDVDIDATGAVTVDAATVAAKGDVLVGEDAEGKRSGSFAAQNGAAVTAGKSVAVYVSGDATAAKGTGERTEVSGKEGVTLDATGDIDVNGAVVKAGVIDEATGAVGEGPAANLTMAAGKGVAVQNGAKAGASGTATVAASGVNNDTDKVGVAVKGEGTQLVSEGDMELSAAAGSVAVSDKAYVGTHGTLGATAAGDVVVKDAGTNVESAKAMTLSGVNVAVTSARVGTSDTLGVTATAGDVTVEGEAIVVAKSDITVAAADFADTTDVVEGNVTIDSSVVTSTAGSVNVGNSTTRIDGDFAAQNGAAVTAGKSVAVYVSGDATAAKGTGERTEVSGKEGATLDATGDIDVNGAVVKAGVIDEATGAVSGGAANLTMAAGKGVTVENGAKVGASGAMTVDANDGVTVKDASYVGANGTFKVGMAEGKTTASLTVQDTAQLVASDSLSAKVGGDVTVRDSAKVGSDKDVSLASTSGNVVVRDAAKVVAASKGDAEGATDAISVKAGGNVEIDGVVMAKADDVVVEAVGTVTVSDKASSSPKEDDAVSGLVQAKGGNVKVASTGSSVMLKDGARLDASKDIEVSAKTTVGINNTAEVEAGKSVTIASTDTAAASAITIDTTGSVTAKDGSVTIDNKNGKVTIENATIGASAKVDIDATDAVTIAKDANAANVTGGTGVEIDTTANGVTINGSTVTATTGDVLVGNATTPIGGSLVAQNGATVEARAGNVKVYAGGNAEVLDTSKVEASGAEKNVEVDAGGNFNVEGTVTANAGDVKATAEGLVDISGTVEAKSTTVGETVKGGNVTLAANGADVAATETIPAKSVVEITGTVAAAAKATVGATAGSVDVDGGSVTATTGDVDIDAKKNVTVQNNAIVTAGNDVTVDTTGGNIVVGKDATAADTPKVTAANGKVTLTANTVADQAVTVQDAAEVKSGAETAITAKGAVEISGTATVEAGTKVDVKSSGVGDIAITTTGKTVGDANKGITANGGNVTIDNDNGKVTIENATVEAKGDSGNMLIAAKGDSGNVKIDTDAKLTADKNLTMDAAKGVEIVTTKAVEAKDGDAVVMAQDGLVDMKVGTKLEADKGNVVIEAKTGVALATVTASTADGTVFVKTDTGDITDANGDDAANVAAKNATFVATAGSVGTGANHVDTSVDVVAASAKSGVFLTEADGVEVGTVAAISVKKVTAVGGVEDKATLSVSGLSTTGSGAVVLEATAGDVNVTQAVEAKGAAGNVLLAANADAGSVTLGASVTAAQNATVVAGKDVNQDADVTATAGDAYVEARKGNVEMASGTKVSAASHNARIAANKNIELSQVVAANVSVKAETGDITDNLTDTPAAEAANVTATKLRLEADGDVGRTTDNLNIDVANLEVKAGGNAIVAENDAVTIGGVGAVTVAKVDTAGGATGSQTDGDLTGIEAASTATLVAGNKVTVSETVGAGNDLLVNAKSGGIDQNANVTAGNNASIIADAGNVNQNADITATAGTIDVEATGGAIVMADGTTAKTEGNGNIRYKAGAGITISKINAGTGSVTLDALGDLTASLDSKVTAGGLAIKANKVGEKNAKMKFSVSKLAVNSKTDVYVDNDKSVTVIDAKGDDFNVNRVKANGATEPKNSGDIEGIAAENGSVDLDVTGGSLTVDSGSSVSSTATTDINVEGDINVDGMVSGKDVALSADNGVDVSGSVSSSGATTITAGSSVGIEGSVSGGSVNIKAGGNVSIEGSTVGGMTEIEAGGGIAFGLEGAVSGTDVSLTAKSGDITQEGATISAAGGYVSDMRVNSAVNASGKATLNAEGGSIGSVGSATANYVGVEAGSIAANAAKDVAIADPNGDGIVVDANGIKAGSSAAVHTAGTITGSGTISAQRLTVSAKSYESGTVKVNVGNTLSVNNFNGGMDPLLAIFEAKGGSDRPNLENLPNKTIVFYNGRLLGGDIKIINTFGAIEAFPVQTPELKSEQGIFGNPVFLHDELDVSNPMAVGAIDFLLLDIPRLTLSSDFPLEVEKQVAAAGLNPTTSYWFGQKPNDADEKEEDSDGNSPDVKGDGDTPSTENQTAMN